MDFYKVVNGKIGFVKGDLYHIWHGDLDKRQYLKKVQEFTKKTKQLTQRDKNGLYITNEDCDNYMKQYYKNREVSYDNSFITVDNIGFISNRLMFNMLLNNNTTDTVLNGDATKDYQTTNDVNYNNETNPNVDNNINLDNNQQTDSLNLDDQLGMFS
jgi:uncharacterized protein (DUF2235 family)